MKKIFLVISFLLLATACDIEYNLSYKDGTFKESASFSQTISESDQTMEETYGPVGSEALKQGDKYYEGAYRSEEDTEYLDLSHEYIAESFENSKIFDCFENSSFVETDDYYSISLSGGFSKCQYINNVKLKFETDKKVVSSNASLSDDEKGVYTWDNAEEGIELQISKKYDLNSSPKSSLWIRLVILTVGFISCIVYLYLRKRVNDA